MINPQQHLQQQLESIREAKMVLNYHEACLKMEDGISVMPASDLLSEKQYEIEQLLAGLAGIEEGDDDRNDK